MMSYLIRVDPPVNAIVVPGTATNVPYECRCDSRDNATVTGSPPIAPPTPVTDSGIAPFVPRLEFRADSVILLNDDDEFPATADRLHVRVVSNLSTDVLDFLSCTVGPTSAASGAVQIVDNYCNVSAALPAMPEDTPVTNQVEFSVAKFSFQGHSTIYLSCVITRCIADDATQSCQECNLGRTLQERELQEDGGSTVPRTATVGAWLRMPANVGLVLPWPNTTGTTTTAATATTAAEETVWDQPRPATLPSNTLAASLTLYGCSADPKESGFRAAVVAAIAAQLSVEEQIVHLTRIAIVATDDLRRLQADLQVGAIIIDYLLLGAERGLTGADQQAFLRTLHGELTQRSLGGIPDGRVEFALAAPISTQDASSAGLGLVIAGVVGGTVLALLICGALAFWWRRRATRQQAATGPNVNDRKPEP